MTHAKLSPSSAFRWLNCPGSIRLSADMPNTSSPAAAEGTKAHELAEHCLPMGKDANKVVGDYPQEMREHVQTYVDYVLAHTVTETGPSILSIETIVDLNEYIPGGFGTADAIILTDTTLHVMDLKYGQQFVKAKKNTQLMLYALGSLANAGKIDSVVMHICQPRLDHWDTYEISPKKLRKWGEKIKPKAALCLTEDAPLVPSDSNCRWCPAAGVCPALQAHSLEVVGGDFASLPAVDELSDEQVSRVVANKVLLLKFIEAAQDSATARLEAGSTIPDLKLVKASVRRYWNDNAEKVIPKLLGDAAYKEPQMINLSDAEKLIGKARFKELDVTMIPESRNIAVSIKDRRKAITPTVEDFDQLETAK